jgi:hypothetical protein
MELYRYFLAGLVVLSNVHAALLLMYSLESGCWSISIRLFRDTVL